MQFPESVRQTLDIFRLFLDCLLCSRPLTSLAFLIQTEVGSQDGFSSQEEGCWEGLFFSKEIAKAPKRAVEFGGG